jgi:hypothetical protein
MTDPLGYSNYAANCSASSSVTMDELHQLMTKMKRRREDLIRSSVEAAKRVYCPICGYVAHFTDKPHDGFIVCSHVLSAVETAVAVSNIDGAFARDASAVLSGLDVWAHDIWLLYVPPGMVATSGEQGQMTWKPLTFGENQ